MQRDPLGSLGLYRASVEAGRVSLCPYSTHDVGTPLCPAQGHPRACKAPGTRVPCAQKVPGMWGPCARKHPALGSSVPVKCSVRVGSLRPKKCPARGTPISPRCGASLRPSVPGACGIPAPKDCPARGIPVPTRHLAWGPVLLCRSCRGN